MVVSKRDIDGEHCAMCNTEFDVDDADAMASCAMWRTDEPTIKVIACGECIQEALRETFGNEKFSEVGL